MTLLRKLTKVRRAQAEVRLARVELERPADALASRVQERPLTSVGIAAGAGVVLAQLNVHPLRLPGIGALLSGGVLDLVAQAVRLFADFGQGNADPS